LADSRSSGQTAAQVYPRSPRIFLRFLRFGLVAWGGPVAQIAAAVLGGGVVGWLIQLAVMRL
jgi:hypothetical protein